MLTFLAVFCFSVVVLGTIVMFPPCLLLWLFVAPIVLNAIHENLS